MNILAQTQGKRLDELSGEEAKAILCQLGYFADDTHFLSLRFTDDQFYCVQEAVVHSGKLSLEQFIANLCHSYVK